MRIKQQAGCKIKSLESSRIAELLSIKKSSSESEWTRKLYDLNSFSFDELSQKSVTLQDDFKSTLPHDEFTMDTESVSNSLKPVKKVKEKLSIDLPFNSTCSKIEDCHKIGGPLSSLSTSDGTVSSTQLSDRLSFSCNSYISITDSQYSDTTGLSSTSSKPTTPMLYVCESEDFVLRSFLQRSACNLPESFKDQNSNLESQKVPPHKFNMKRYKNPRAKIKEPNRKKRSRKQKPKDFLTTGTTLLYCRRDNHHWRHFEVDTALNSLVWYSPTISITKTRVALADINEVVLGQKSPGFCKFSRKSLIHQSFSIKYQSNK